MLQKELSKYAKQFHYHLKYHFGLCGLNHPKNLDRRPKSKRLFDLARIIKSECAYEKWDSAKHNLLTLVAVFDAGLKGAMGYYIIPRHLRVCGYVYQLGKAFAGFAQEYDECRLSKAAPVSKGSFDNLTKFQDVVTASTHDLNNRRKITSSREGINNTTEYWEKKYRQLKEVFDTQEPESRSNLDAASRKIFVLEQKLNESAAVVDDLTKNIQKQTETLYKLSDIISIREEKIAKLQKIENDLATRLHKVSESRKNIIDTLVEVLKTHSL